MSSELYERIWRIVRQIPPGNVSTYGQIAAAVGNPRLARVVGYAMHTAPDDVPCHRVVKQDGSLSGAFQPMGQATHRMLLEMEGVSFAADGRVLASEMIQMEAEKEDS